MLSQMSCYLEFKLQLKNASHALKVLTGNARALHGAINFLLHLHMFKVPVKNHDHWYRYDLDH